MKLNKSKKGISLIVLVITIIVMIILATAIILSLNSSNISGKANEAKLSSDLANKKEAASVYLSEYEIKVAKGKIDRDTTSANDYVRTQIKKAGLDSTDVFITDEGDIVVGVAAMFQNNNIPIGATVEGYKLNNTKTYKTSGKENTGEYYGKHTDNTTHSTTITRDETIKWTYIGLDNDGNVLLVTLPANNTLPSLSKPIYVHFIVSSLVIVVE